MIAGIITIVTTLRFQKAESFDGDIVIKERNILNK